MILCFLRTAVISLSLEPYVSDMNEMTLTYVLPADGTYGEAPILSLLTKDVEQ